MNNYYFLKQLLFFALFFSAYLLSAQGVFIEHNRGISENITSEVNLGTEDYAKVFDEDGVKLYTSSSTINKNTVGEMSSTIDGVNGTIPLTIDFIFDPAQSAPPYFIMIYNELGYFDSTFFPNPTSHTFNVPPGSYDVMVDYSVTGSDNYIVVKEQIQVTGNLTIQADVAEADNYISIDVYGEDGELMEPGELNPETEMYSTIFFDRIIRFVPFNIMAYYQYSIAEPLEDGPVWNFHISDISDRYAIMNTAMGIMFGEDSYYLKLETIPGVSSDINISNDPDKWVFHHDAFQPSVIGEAQATSPAYTTQTLFGDMPLVSRTISIRGLPLDPEQGFSAYLDNPVNEDPSTYLVFPSVVDFYGLIDPTWIDENFLTTGNAVYSDESGNVHYGSNNTGFAFYFLGNNYYNNDGTGFTLLPFNPKFAFSEANNPDVVFGGSTPIMTSLIMVNPNESNFFNGQYRGRHGELRESDFFATQIEVKQNGGSLFTGNYTDFLWTYGLFSAGLPTSGTIELNLSNANLTVDGLPGKNTTKISYNADLADMPPTLQALQFRDDSDKVTSIFPSVENASVRLAAADYNLELNEFATPYYSYNDGNIIEFYYSLYDEDEWTELELTEYPEHFFLPAFGDYYETSLQSIIVPQDNTWFDVKIICTDAAGNKQEQIVSPAFKIEQATMGIEEVQNSGITVYPNPFKNEFNVQVSENISGNYTFKLTDMTGKVIYTEKKSEKSFTINGGTLPKGIYILSIENNGKTIAKKVIKN